MAHRLVAILGATDHVAISRPGRLDDGNHSCKLLEASGKDHCDRMLGSSNDNQLTFTLFCAFLMVEVSHGGGSNVSPTTQLHTLGELLKVRRSRKIHCIQ